MASLDYPSIAVDQPFRLLHGERGRQLNRQDRSSKRSRDLLGDDASVKGSRQLPSSTSELSFGPKAIEACDNFKYQALPAGAGAGLSRFPVISGAHPGDITVPTSTCCNSGLLLWSRVRMWLPVL